MPRSSHHKSLRSSMHSARDEAKRSDSEDDGSSRDRRLVEASHGSGVRVSSDVEVGKRKASSSLRVSLEKDKGGSENADFSGRKRKKREEDSATPDRCNGKGRDDGLPEKGSKNEAFGHVDSEKKERSRILTDESRSRSGRRREGSTERDVESGRRSEPVKIRSEQEHTRREYRKDKESDIDRPSESDNKALDSRHRRSDDAESKSRRSRWAVAEVGWKGKKDSTGKKTRNSRSSLPILKMFLSTLENSLRNYCHKFCN